jgi:hypothetical protein
MNSNFKENEIVKFERWNKKLKKNVIVEFPVVGGRLRLFHEDLAKADSSQVAGGVDVEVIEHDREYALIKAKVCINGNAFTGIGMASKSRDSMIFPAIMEMAETRAIARALRFAGYGVEYTGAEEMQGVKNFDDSQQQDTSKSSEGPTDVKVFQDVNDDMPKEETPVETPVETPGEPSLKRQVWELVTRLYPSVQENYLADAVFSFVSTTMAKYDDKDAEAVYRMVIDNQDRFAGAFGRFVDDAIPDIKSNVTESGEKESVPETDTGVEREEKKKEFLEATSEPAEINQEKMNEAMKEAAENMKIAPPPPAVDAGKVAKANIYRAMPDGINVAALNGTLKHLITENAEYEAGTIYDMVLGDIDGFVVMLKNWCSNNDVPSGLEPKTDKPVLKIDAKKPVVDPVDDPVDKPAATGKEFRKSWVRLDMENFNKFIIQNCDTFKSDREEYDLAVAKFDRLKAKDKETENLVFPYYFDASDIPPVEAKPKLSTENSILEEADAGSKPEISVMVEYLNMFPDLSGKISEAIGIDLKTDIDSEALKFNEKIEQMLTEYETEHKKAYTED